MPSMTRPAAVTTPPKAAPPAQTTDPLISAASSSDHLDQILEGRFWAVDSQRNKPKPTYVNKNYPGFDEGEFQFASKRLYKLCKTGDMFEIVKRIVTLGPTGTALMMRVGPRLPANKRNAIVRALHVYSDDKTKTLFEDLILEND